MCTCLARILVCRLDKKVNCTSLFTKLHSIHRMFCIQHRMFSALNSDMYMFTHFVYRTALCQGLTLK
jgi:hypothetical protein